MQGGSATIIIENGVKRGKTGSYRRKKISERANTVAGQYGKALKLFDTKELYFYSVADALRSIPIRKVKLRRKSADIHSGIALNRT